MNRLRLLAMAPIAPLLVAFAVARPLHGELDEQIARTTEWIRRQPARADLYLSRAELHRLHGDGRAACKDLDSARELEPEIAGLALARARLDLSMGWRFAALVRLERTLARNPREAEAWALLARLRGEDGDLGAAIECSSRAIEHAVAPDPELYLQRARWLISADSDALPAAIAGLDQGLARLGAVPALGLMAVELEMQRGEIERALERLEQLARPSGRQENWLALRADLLRRAGRLDEARIAYERALASVRALPLRRRATSAALELHRRLARGLAAFDATPKDEIQGGPRTKP